MSGDVPAAAASTPTLPSPDPRALQGPRLPRREWPRVVVRAVKALLAGGGTDWAAVVTYYTVLSLVPIVLAGVSLLALFGGDTIAREAGDGFARAIADQTSSASADDAADALQGIIETALGSSQGAASVTFGLSLVVALNGASGAFAAIGRALNQIHGVEDTRGFVRGRIAQVLLALVVIVLLAVAVVSFALGGRISETVFDAVGIGSAGRLTWSLVRLPLALAVAVFTFGLVYTVAPATRRRRIRPFTVGALVGVLGWGLASLGFVLYVQLAGFGSAYGALGGTIVLLFWLWLSSITFLLGAHVDVEAARTRRMRGGGPPVVASGATHSASSD